MAVAKESLSPLLRNSQVRRLSIELCQKVGSQLLSSPLSLSQSASPGGETSVLGIGKENVSSPNFLNSTTTTLRRKSAGCILSPIQIQNQSRSQSPQSQNSSVRAPGSPFKFQNQVFVNSPNRRRSSLTPGTKFQPFITAAASTTATAAASIPTIKIHGVSTQPTSTSLSVSVSPSIRHDFGDSFLKFVSEKCDVQLNPEDVLGRGSFGTVVSGIYKGQPVAAKVMSINTPCQMDCLAGEQIALKLPPHPNITKIIDIFQFGGQSQGQSEGQGGQGQGQVDNSALVLMERLRPGNLLHVLNDVTVIFDKATCLRISAQITAGILFCHQFGILHLDLKPQNILIDLLGQQCKISDFGNAKRIADLQKCSAANFLKLEGTVIYKAPELFRGFCPTEKCDIFSLGITMWQILNREWPYQGETEHSIIYKVVAQGLRPPILRSALLGNPQNNLCIMCWDADPTNRPRAQELLGHLNYLQVNTMNLGVQNENHLRVGLGLFF